jgi:hypothetical protein
VLVRAMQMRAGNSYGGAEAAFVLKQLGIAAA